MKRALMTLALGIAEIVLFAAGMIGFQMLLHRLHVGNLAAYAILLPVELALYALIVRLLERRRISELNPRACAPQSAGGFLTGIVIFSVAIAVLAVGGFYHVSGHASLTVVFAPLLIWFSAAAAEELIFRGFIFRVIEKAGGTWVALAISSLLFGLAHAFNAGATPWSTIAIALQAGVLLGLAYTLTRSLWLPIGIHAGWNFAEGTLYGSPVSGFHTPGFLHAVLHGPIALTGGRFGVEASIEATAACLAASVVLYTLAARSNRIISFNPAKTPAAKLAEAAT